MALTSNLAIVTSIEGFTTPLDAVDSGANSPARKSAAYVLMEERWKLPDLLIAGTDAMREIGHEEFLPRDDAEKPAEWEARVARSFLHPAYEKAVLRLANKPFSKPVQWSKTTPDQIVEWGHDIDRSGNSVDTLLQDVLFQAINRGLTHLWVDNIRSENLDVSLLEAKEKGFRPSINHLEATRLRGWRWAVINGSKTLTQVRIREETMEPDGLYGEVFVEKMRVYQIGDLTLPKGNPERNVFFQTFRKVRTAKGIQWVPEPGGAGRLGIDFIPLVTIYTNFEQFMVASPAMKALAWLNLRHWQSSSDQNNILHVGRVPILHWRGLGDVSDAAKRITVGSRRMFLNKSPDARLEYVEISATGAIDAGFKDLSHLEDVMDELGLLPTMQKTGNITATGQAIDMVESNSTLQAWIRGLERGFNQATRIARIFAGEEDPDDSSEISIFQDFGVGAKRTEELTELREWRVNEDLSRRTLWREGRRRNMLGDDFDADEELEQIALEREEEGSIAPPAEDVAALLDASPVEDLDDAGPDRETVEDDDV